MITKCFTILNERLTKSGCKWIAGDKITYGDFCLAAIYCNMANNPKCPFNAPLMMCCDNFPKLKEYFCCVAKEVEPYCKSRPERNF